MAQVLQATYSFNERETIQVKKLLQRDEYIQVITLGISLANRQLN